MLYIPLFGRDELEFKYEGKNSRRIEDMRKLTKPLFISLFFTFLLISSSTGLVLMSGSCNDDLENPNGEGVWEFRDASISILHSSNKSGVDYERRKSTVSGNTLSTTVVQETEDTVTVNLSIELTDDTQTHINIDIDYNELQFEIDKKDNDATLVEEGHPWEGKRIGFFPFFGFAEEEVYDNTYPYFMGGESEPVSFLDHKGVSVTQVKEGGEIDEQHYTVESIYKLTNKIEEDLTYQYLKEAGNKTREIGSCLSVSFKQYRGRLYPFSAGATFPSELFVEDPADDEALISIGGGLSYEQQDVIEYIQELPPMENPHEGNDLAKMALFLGVPGAIAIVCGYVAYKKKEGG